MHAPSIVGWAGPRSVQRVQHHSSLIFLIAKGRTHVHLRRVCHVCRGACGHVQPLHAERCWQGKARAASPISAGLKGNGIWSSRKTCAARPLQALWNEHQLCIRTCVNSCPTWSYTWAGSCTTPSKPQSSAGLPYPSTQGAHDCAHSHARLRGHSTNVQLAYQYYAAAIDPGAASRKSMCMHVRMNV